MNNRKLSAIFAAMILCTGVFVIGNSVKSVSELNESHEDLSLGSSGVELAWAKNFGGSGQDVFNSVVMTSDGGFVVVGTSAAASFGTGDWAGITGRGGTDAIIVKFDSSGDVVWMNRFGGLENDYFNSVVMTSDGGFVAVGYSYPASFGTGDWAGITGRGGMDAIIVKFDSSGDVVWMNRFGGSGADIFNSVTATSDGGFVAVGHATSFGTGDWAGVAGQGNDDAIIVKFDSNGTMVWKNRFGGIGNDRFLSVTATYDEGFVAVGYVGHTSFGTGDFVGIVGRGDQDAVITKFDSFGNLDWMSIFGGSGVDEFNGVTETLLGNYVCVGVSYSQSFGSGDLIGIVGNGSRDAIIVEYDYSGFVTWCKSFGGSGADSFASVISTQDGDIIAVGQSQFSSFGNGNLIDFVGRGSTDAIVVNFDSFGSVIWAGVFGGSGADSFSSVTELLDGSIIAVGSCSVDSPGTGDLFGMAGKGSTDAIVVNFDPRLEIVSLPVNLVVQGSNWSYTPQTDPSGTTISVTGASWLSSNGTTISGTAPAPLDGISQTYDLTITASKAGARTATQNVSLTVHASLTFTTVPTPAINITQTGPATFFVDASGSEDFTSLVIDLGDGNVVDGILSIEHTFEVKSRAVHMTVSATNNMGTAQITSTVLIPDDEPETVAWTTVEYRFAPDLDLTIIPTFTLTGPTGFAESWLVWNNAQRAVVGIPTPSEAYKTYTATLIMGGETLTWDIQVLPASTVVPTASIEYSIDELELSLFAISNTPGNMALHSWTITSGGSLIATSSHRDPVISLAAGGIYSVALTITNSNGTATSTSTIFVPSPELPPEEEDDKPLPIAAIILLVLGAMIFLGGLAGSSSGVAVLGFIVAIVGLVLIFVDASSIVQSISDLLKLGE